MGDLAQTLHLLALISITNNFVKHLSCDEQPFDLQNSSHPAFLRSLHESRVQIPHGVNALHCEMQASICHQGTGGSRD